MDADSEPSEEMIHTLTVFKNYINEIEQVYDLYVTVPQANQYRCLLHCKFLHMLLGIKSYSMLSEPEFMVWKDQLLPYKGIDHIKSLWHTTKMFLDDMMSRLDVESVRISIENDFLENNLFWLERAFECAVLEIETLELDSRFDCDDYLHGKYVKIHTMWFHCMCKHYLTVSILGSITDRDPIENQPIWSKLNTMNMATVELITAFALDRSVVDINYAKDDLNVINSIVQRQIDKQLKANKDRASGLLTTLAIELKARFRSYCGVD
jgi:hypothetical protein